MPPTTLLTAAEVAAQLGVSPRTIIRWADRGTLPHAHRLPGRTGAYLFERGVVAMFARGRNGHEKAAS